MFINIQAEYYTAPVKRCGNFIGKITASFNDSFADSNPATSFHLTFGFSSTIAPERMFYKFNA